MKEKIAMDELRSWYEVPAIAHYFHIFRRSFELIEFEIEDFEETLFLDSAENVSTFLPDLVIRLLRGMYKTKDGLQVTLENYNYYLSDLLNHHYVEVQKKSNPLADSEFKNLSTRTKVEILFDICNWRLELHDAMELTKDLEANEMRVDPVGCDDEGNIYWYFYGTRLYKEGFSVKKEEVNHETDHQTESENEVDVPIKKRSSPRKLSKRKNLTTKSGRSVKKRKRFFDESSQESANDSERSVEALDEEGEDSNLSKPDIKPIKLSLTVNAWSLICSTLEEWNNLSSKFKGSRNKNEKELNKNLNRLMESVPDLFQEQEKALQRKLLAMAPRRQSDRITIKMQQKEEEERRLEQERLLKKQRKVKDEEERLKQLEVEKEKEREKRYKARERVHQERALRAQLREEQKLVADYPDLLKEVQSTKQKSKRKGTDSDEETDEDYDDIYAAMERIMEVLNKDEDAWLFLEPVDEEDAPNYYDYIKNPMDFQTIGEKIMRKEYQDKDEFEDDVMLIFENCETYNGTGSSYHKLALSVKKVFEKVFKQEFPPDVDLDDDDFFEMDELSARHNKIKKLKIDNQDKAQINPMMSTAPIVGKNVLKSGFTSMELARAQAQQAHVRIQQIHQSAGTLKTSPRAALAAVANMLPKSYGITADMIAKMSPGQMQALVLNAQYPKTSLAPPLSALAPRGMLAPQFAWSQRQGNLTNPASVKTSINTTTLNPLQQLANTALAPAVTASGNLSKINPRFSIPNFSVRTVSNTMSPGQVLTIRPRMPSMLGSSNLGQAGRGHAASNRGRPKKVTIAPNLKSLQNPQVSVISGVNATGSPIAVKWEDLKHHLIKQMKPDTKITISPASGMASLQTPMKVPTSIMPQLRPLLGSVPTNLKIERGMDVSTTAASVSKMFSFANILRPKGSSPSSLPVSLKSIITQVPLGAVNQNVITNSIVSSAAAPENFVTLNTLPSKLNSGLSPMLSQGHVRFFGVPSGLHQVPPGVLVQRASYPVAQQSVYTPKSIAASLHYQKPVFNPGSRVTITAPTSKTIDKTSLIELQKAALQAAAINQISTKLQTHLKDEKQTSITPKGTSTEMFGQVVAGTSSLPICTIVMSPSKSDVLSSVKSNIKINNLVSSPIGSLPPTALSANSSSLIPQHLQSFHHISAANTVRMTLPQQPPLQLTRVIMANTGSQHQETAHVNSNLQQFASTVLSPKPTSTVSGQVIINSNGIAQQGAVSINVDSKSSVPPLAVVRPPAFSTQKQQTLAASSATPQPVRYVIPQSALIGKSVVSGNQLILQQTMNSQGQTIQYILPSQNTAVGNNVVNLAQLNGLQNAILSSTSISQGLQPGRGQVLINNLSSTKLPTTQTVMTTISSQIPPALGLMQSNIVTVPTNLQITSKFSNTTNVVTQPSVLSIRLPINSNTLQSRQLVVSSPLKTNSSISRVNGINSNQLVNGNVSAAQAKPPQSAITQKAVTISPAELQKLKDEGRIFMMPSGQLVMVPTNSSVKSPLVSST